VPRPPLACTLAPEGIADRLAFIRALAADGLLARIPTASGVRMRLRDTPDIERRARELVAGEARCCPWLDLSLERDDEALVLEIGGPAEARAAIDAFFAPPPVSAAGSVGRTRTGRRAR
jgi:hypothetical protein